MGNLDSNRVKRSSTSRKKWLKIWIIFATSQRAPHVPLQQRLKSTAADSIVLEWACHACLAKSRHVSSGLHTANCRVPLFSCKEKEKKKIKSKVGPHCSSIRNSCFKRTPKGWLSGESLGLSVSWSIRSKVRFPLSANNSSGPRSRDTGPRFTRSMWKGRFARIRWISRDKVSNTTVIKKKNHALNECHVFFFFFVKK